MNRKTIVITGSTRGIGRAMAIEFLGKNHQVLINGRNRELVDNEVAELRKKGFDAQGVAGDIKDASTFQSIIDKAIDSFGKIDIWINNAGIPQSFKYFHDLDDEEILELISVNVIGLMLGTKAAINFFKVQGYGKIFNMEGFGSDGRIMQKLSLYGTSKRAVNYFTKSASKEIKEKNIQLGILSPGMVRTDFIKKPMDMGTEEEKARSRKVFAILAEDAEVVVEFLVRKILVSNKKYARIDYLTTFRLFPKIVRLMFVR